MKRTHILHSLLLGAALSGCTGIPPGAEPVTGFQLERYLGTWYEIARLDHRFERGLTQVSAEYAMRGDGGVRVVNRGYDVEAGTWQEAVCKAYFIDEPDVGRLKVSFFGPFYGAYNVLALGVDYDYALVAGPNLDYLWLLSRQRVLDPAIQSRLLEQAAAVGYDVDALIFVEQREGG